MKRIIRAVVPAFLLAVSVGQIYAFTNFSDPIAQYFTGGDAEAMRSLLPKVQFAFSLGIFFLGMGAAFFGKIVERNIRLSTIIGTALFISGLVVTGFGITVKSIALIYLGYGLLIGLGTGIIYISPVKTMMLWFPEHKAIAAALPIISFGLGSTLSTIVYKGFGFGTEHSLFAMRFLGFFGYFNVEGWAYEDFFFKELIPYVEKTWRVKADKQHRALAGLSMGGGGTTKYAQHHPDMFCAAYAMSALMSIPGQGAVMPQRPGDKVSILNASVIKNSCIDFVKNADDAVKENLKTVTWFVDCGDDDFLLDRNIEFVQAMKAAQIPVQFRVRDGGHTWEYWHSALYTALPFISRCFGK